jgi:hypothetical protein
MIKNKFILWNFKQMNKLKNFYLSKKNEKFFKKKLKIFFFKKFKRNLKFEIKKKKKLILSKKKKKSIFNEKKKKEILNKIFERIKKNKKLISNFFTIIFLGVKIGYFLYSMKLVFQFFLRIFSFEYFWITISLLEYKHKKKNFLSEKIIFEGILQHFDSNFLPKEYFRQILILKKSIFRYLKFFNNFKNYQTKFLFKKNIKCLKIIFNKIIWSFFFKFKNYKLIENLIQISAKEIWNSSTISILNEKLYDLIKIICAKKINLIDNLQYVYISKKLLLKNIFLKSLKKKSFHFYNFIPINKIFSNFKEKKKKLIIQNFLFIKMRNNIQISKMKF